MSVSSAVLEDLALDLDLPACRQYEHAVDATLDEQLVTAIGQARRAGDEAPEAELRRELQAHYEAAGLAE